MLPMVVPGTAMAVAAVPVAPALRYNTSFEASIQAIHDQFKGFNIIINMYNNDEPYIIYKEKLIVTS